MSFVGDFVPRCGIGVVAVSSLLDSLSISTIVSTTTGGVTGRRGQLNVLHDLFETSAS